MLKPEHLYQSPNALARHYTRFRVGERLLLTGHSHQAWPDYGFIGQCQAWLEAAEFMDAKWERVFAKAERVRQGFAGLLDDTQGHVALGQNTHELLVRFLSALPLGERPRLLTTRGEFHTIRRQLDRLSEEGISVEKVQDQPARAVAERLVRAVNDKTAAVLVSSVLYESGHIVPGLGFVLEACQKVGVPLLVDAYHSLNVVPFSVKKERLEDAFILGGGYKYCQLGEGNCFLRFPKDCEMRPVITGWFSEFDILATARSHDRVAYGAGPARFASSTYDPTSHYRAAKVFDFFQEQKLTPSFLRQVNQHQVGLLARLFDELDADPELITRDSSLSLDEIGGFLTLRSRKASLLCSRLRKQGVFTDYRGNFLRLGPAPYLSDQQLEVAMGMLGQALATL